MKFYYHQESYGVIDRTEIKRILHLIANSKGTDGIVYCSGWATPVEYDLRARKTYNLCRNHRFWGEEFIDIKYKALSSREAKDLKDSLDKSSFETILITRAKILFKKYKVKIGFYKAHVENNNILGYDDSEE